MYNNTYNNKKNNNVYNNKKNNSVKTYTHKINTSDQIKSSSSGEILEIIQFPNAIPKLLNEYRARYQEYRLKDLKMEYKPIFNMPAPTPGGANVDTIVSYMGRCHKDGLSDDYDSLLSTEGSYKYSIYESFNRYWHPRKDVINEWGFNQTATEIGNFGTFKVKGFTNLVGSLIGEVKAEYTYEFRGAKIDIHDSNMNE